MGRRAEVPSVPRPGENTGVMLVELGNKLAANVGLTPQSDLKSRVMAVVLGTLAVAPFTSQLVLWFGAFAVAVLIWLDRR